MQLWSDVIAKQSKMENQQNSTNNDNRSGIEERQNDNRNKNRSKLSRM